MSVEATYYTQKKDRTFVLSLVFLVFVIGITVGLYGWNWYLDGQNVQTREQITASENTIKILKEDKKVQIYDLIQANGGALTKLQSQSQITAFIKHIKYISSQYDLTFKTFNYSNGIISTNGLFADNTKGLAYVKLSQFIAAYRTKEDRLFDLQFVNNVSGQDQIEVALQFKIK